MLNTSKNLCFPNSWTAAMGYITPPGSAGCLDRYYITPPSTQNPDILSYTKYYATHYIYNNQDTK